MIKITSNSNNVIIVLHEIYGINQHIKDFGARLAKEGFDVICPNLLDQETSFNYSEENNAYHHFMENVGFNSANVIAKELISQFKSVYNNVFIIGFSIGATVAWNCSEVEDVDGIIGFYGSRIRDYLDIKPICPVLLFFPIVEQSFSVDELIVKLDKMKVSTYKLNGEHGFSDPYSMKYHEESDQFAFKEIMNFINTNIQ